MTAARVPLFRFDSGWLFIIAGLAMCIGCALTSADRELQTLRVQNSLLEAEEEYAYARLRAHEDFLRQLDEPDEALTRRLAAAELNLMPADEEPVLRLITLELPTVEWIDRTVERPAPQPVPASNSMLANLATGRYRLWVFSAGVMCVFLGLLLDPSVSSDRRRGARFATFRWRESGTVDADADADGDAGAIDALTSSDGADVPLAVRLHVDTLEEEIIERQSAAASSVVREVEALIDEIEGATGDGRDGATDDFDDSPNDVSSAEDGIEAGVVDGWLDNEGDDECESLCVEDDFDVDESDDEPTVDLDADELHELSADRVLCADDAEGISDAARIDESEDEHDVESDERPAEGRSVISIRPSMSVAPPIGAGDDEPVAGAPVDDDQAELWGAAREEWDDGAVTDDEKRAPKAQPRRTAKSKRSRKRR